jgi:hypothetical protein
MATARDMEEERVGVMTRRMAALQQAAAAGVVAEETQVMTTRGWPLMRTPGVGSGTPLDQKISSTPGNLTSLLNAVGVDFLAAQRQMSERFEDAEMADDKFTAPFREEVLAHRLRVLSRTGLVRGTAGDMVQAPLWYVPATTPPQTMPMLAEAALVAEMAGGMEQSSLTGPARHQSRTLLHQLGRAW